MEFKRFFAVAKGETPEHVMPANHEQLKALNERLGGSNYTFAPTMGITETEEMNDVARELGDGADVDVYEVTFRKIKTGRVTPDVNYKLEE